MEKSLTYTVILFVAVFFFQENVSSQEIAIPSSRSWWGVWDGAWQSSPLKSEKAKQLPLIKVAGNKFVNSLGNIILFRGACAADPDKCECQGHWNKDYFVKIKETGAMVVRIPIHPAGWRMRTPEKYLGLLDQAVEWCTDLGMYVMIDWHTIGNLGTELFQVPIYNTTKQETYQFWRDISIHFKGHNTVAFYEIFNEPTTYADQLGPMEWAEWKKINEDIIKLIRAIDPDPIPLVAGLDWGYDLKPVKEDPVMAGGIGYVSHPYEFKQAKPYRQNWEKNFGYVAGKYPVIVTEYAFDMEPGTTTYENLYANELIDYLEEKGISWVCWIFDTDWPPQMIKTWDTFELTGSGQFFKKAMQGKLNVQND